MIRGKYLIYVHIPKCAGTFISAMLRMNSLGEFVGGRGLHVPIRKVNNISVPVLASIRNPWSWYVSWWAFLKTTTKYSGMKGHPNYFWNSNLKFKEYMKIMFDDNRNKKLIDKQMLVGNEFEYVFRDMVNDDCGFYTLTWKYMTRINGKDAVDHYFKMENVRKELITYLKLSGKSEKNILNSNAIRTSLHKGYQGYYDTELMNLVAHKDREIINKFDYTF